MSRLEHSHFFLQKTFLKKEKIFLAVTSFEATSYVSDITDSNINFGISTKGRLPSRGGAVTINRLIKFLELRFENDIELQVKKVKKRGLTITKEFLY